MNSHQSNFHLYQPENKELTNTLHHTKYMHMGTMASEEGDKGRGIVTGLPGHFQSNILASIS